MKRSIAQSNEQNDDSDSGEVKVFSVNYANASTKKHKSYKYDGTLEVHDKDVVLKDLQGKVSSLITIR